MTFSIPVWMRLVVTSTRIIGKLSAQVSWIAIVCSDSKYYFSRDDMSGVGAFTRGSYIQTGYHFLATQL
jgi:hypothetical protein